MSFEASTLKAYFVAGTQDVGGHEQLLATLNEALKAGITMFQFREKGLTALQQPADRLALAKAVHQLTQQYQVPLIIDDDVDLAIEIGAEGVHVGQKDQAIETVIAQIPEDMILGYSCNTLPEIEKANQLSRVDYLGIGPVFATGSKADADQPVGIDGLTKLVQGTTLPTVAIGGINATNIADVLATGVDGASVISMITKSDNVEATVHEMMSF